jgi:hypothetical protein
MELNPDSGDVQSVHRQPWGIAAGTEYAVVATPS